MESDVKKENRTKRPIVDERIGRFPERLKEAIGRQSVRAFSQKAGISGTVISKYLSGVSEPTRPALISMADAADISVQWLATGEGSKEVGSIEGSFDRWAAFHYLHNMMLDTFEYNKRNEKRSALAIFLAYFSEAQKDSLLDVSLSVASQLNSSTHIIYCEDKSLIEIAEDLTEINYKTNNDGFNAIAEMLIEKDDIFIFCDLFKSKYTNNKGLYRDLIKIIEKNPLDDKKIPKCNVVFLDSPAFLEKNWGSLGVYFKTNILNGSSFFI